MAKKTQFIRTRVDEAMHRMIEESAARSFRSIQDQIRYLLAKALGLVENGDRPITKDFAKRPRFLQKPTKNGSDDC